MWPITPTMVTAFVGTNLTLGVSYSGVTAPVVTWQNGTLVLASWTIGQSNPPDINPTYSSVLSVDQTGSLVFQNIPVSYSGTYTAKMAKSGDREVSVDFTVLVYSKYSLNDIFCHLMFIRFCSLVQIHGQKTTFMV